MLRGVLAVPVMRPNVDGVVIVSVGLPITTWFSTLVNWKLKSAPMPSRKTAIVLLTRRDPRSSAGQAAQGVAAAIGVEAENALAELGEDRGRDRRTC